MIAVHSCSPRRLSIKLVACDCPTEGASNSERNITISKPRGIVSTARSNNIRLSDPSQGRRKVQRLADYGEPGRDADAHPQGGSAVGHERWNCLGESGTRVNSSFRVMLDGLRISEICKHTSPLYLATKPPLRLIRSAQ